MSSLSYYLASLVLALAGIAVASALIARQLRLREQRRVQAEAMLGALASYSEWVAAQRRAVRFAEPADGWALDKVRLLWAGTFPELSADMNQLLLVHVQLVDFLAAQQQLRAVDPEAWLESDHDGQFMALWREHRLAVHRLAERLRRTAGPVIDAEPESIFPA